MAPSFAIGESIKFGWEKLRQYPRVLLLTTLILLVCSIGARIFQFLIQHNESWQLALVWGIGDALLWLGSAVFGVGLAIISLKCARGEEISLGDLIPPWRLFVQFVVASFLVGLIIAVVMFVFTILTVICFAFLPRIEAALLALFITVVMIAAALYIGLRYSMVRYLAIDGVRPIPSILPGSTRMAMGAKWRLLLFFIVLVLLNIAGLLCVLVGLLISIPVTAIAYARIYLALKDSSGGEAGSQLKDGPQDGTVSQTSA